MRVKQLVSLYAAGLGLQVSQVACLRKEMPAERGNRNPPDGHRQMNRFQGRNRCLRYSASRSGKTRKVVTLVRGSRSG